MFFKSSYQGTSTSYIPSMLDPVFAATLVFSKEKKQKEVEDGYSAIMLSLVRKGYIDLTRINDTMDWTVNNINIIINYNPNKYSTSTYMNPSSSYTSIYTSSFSTNSNGNALNGFNTYNNPNPYQTMMLNNARYMGNNSYNPNNKFNNTDNYNGAYMHDYTNDSNNHQDDYNPLEDTKLLEPLTQTEEHYFNLILRHSYGRGYVSLKAFQDGIFNDYDHTDKFVRNMESAITNIGISEGYFQKTNYKQPMKSIHSLATFYLVVGIILLTIVNLISSSLPIGLAYGGYTILGIVLIICSKHIRKKNSLLNF